jgi:hypothetical protein
VLYLEVGEKLTEIAAGLNDFALLAKLSGGDAVSQELKYHLLCYAGLENKKRSHDRMIENVKQEELTTKDKEAHAIALSELITYMYEKRVSSIKKSPPVFQLKDLTNMYLDRLRQLEVSSASINKTRLKEQVLYYMPEIEANKQGRNVVFAFKKDIGTMLTKGSEYDDGLILAKAATILRKHMLKNKSSLTGTFDHSYIEQSVPLQLLQLLPKYLMVQILSHSLI